MIPSRPRADLAFHGDRIGVVRLATPPENALGPELLEAFSEAIDAFEDHEARVLVIASDVAGAFARGGDVAGFSRQDGGGYVEYMHAMRAAFDRVDGLGVPSIAAIDGTAVGGGLELALACTFRVAGEDARMGLPQVKLGVIPGAGGTQRLPRIVGNGKALDLLVTGRSVATDEAYAIGLVDRRAPAGAALDAALELATAISAVPGAALRALHRATEAASGTSFSRGMAVEAREALALFERGAARERATFLDRRPPAGR